MLSQNFVKDKVQTIIHLPTLPAIAEQIAELVEHPKTTAAQIAEVIAMDPGLTTKVLKIANSSFYGFPKKISTIDFAIIVLGFDAVREIVISISLVTSLQNKNDQNESLKNFWDHAIYCSVIARRLARDLGYRVSGEVFVGALLHDMGISIVREHFQKQYEEIIEIVQTGVAWTAAEERSLGVTHAEIGGWLAERWNFPSALVEAIAFHHNPLSARENPDLVSIVHCADVIANRLAPSPVMCDRDLHFDPAVLERLGLGNEVLLEERIAAYRQILEKDIEQHDEAINSAKS